MWKILNSFDHKKIGVWVVRGKTPTIHMPRLYNVFDMPNIKSVRAVTSMRTEVNMEEILKRVPRVRRIRSANKDVAKFEIRRGAYLLLFPSGYVEVHAPNEDGVREVLVAFRDELYECGLIKR